MFMKTRSGPDTSSTEDMTKNTKSDLTNDTSQICISFDYITLQSNLCDSTVRMFKIGMTKLMANLYTKRHGISKMS